MAATSASPATRLACNRCHQQKLRCHRSPLPGHPCTRCENAGVPCIFEPPLRPGRPSTRRKSRTKPIPPSHHVSRPASCRGTSPLQTQTQPQSRRGTAGSLDLPHLDGLFEVDGDHLHLNHGSSDSSYAAHSPRSDENALGFDYGTAPALDLDNIVGAPDWLDAFCCSSQSQSPSIAPNPVGSQAQSHLHPQQCPPSQLHPTTNSNNDGFPAGLAGPQSVSASSASSAPSAVSASVSTASSVAGVPAPTVDFYRLSELSLTLHEYCQRAQTYAQSSADAMVPPPTIDQVLAVTQSLTDVLAPFSTSLSADAYTTTSSPRSNHVHGVNDPLRASLDYSQNHHLPLPPRSAPDAATTLLILSCYLRLLDLYNTILLNANPTPGHCSPPGTLPLPMPGSMTGPGQGQAHQPLHLQIGCFSTPMASSTALLTFLSSQLLGNLETSLSALASSPQLGPSKAAAAISRVGSQSSLSNAASEYGFGSCASAGGGGPASSVMFLTNAAVMEAKSLRRNLKSQFQGLSPAFWGE